LSYLANTETDRQTNSGKNITSLAKVNILFVFTKQHDWVNLHSTEYWIATGIMAKSYTYTVYDTCCGDCDSVA